jgi:hypothetical protein
MARTQVVDGLGARELVKAIQRELSIEAVRSVKEPGGRPVEVDR